MAGAYSGGDGRRGFEENDDGVDQKLVGAYYEATLWLIDQIKHHGWHHVSADYLCEYARARYLL